MNLGTGAVTVAASRTITVNSSTLTVGGAIGGSGFSLTKAGTGMLSLTGNDSYAGPTIVSGGTLQIAGTYTGGPNFVRTTPH